jgi:hypothetical protein
MDLKQVRKIIEKVLITKEYDEEFMHFHKNRNQFNSGKIESLSYIENNEFRDNYGHIWHEVSTIKNYFHMPKTEYVKSLLLFGFNKPYSRKFLRDDNGILKGEYEMIIGQDGKRIDAITSPDYQETYNFGRTSKTNEHYILDVKSHNMDSKYEFKRDMGYVKIYGEGT